MDLRLEGVVLPVADVDRAKSFYDRLGFRFDADFPGSDGYRIVQFTPPGSPASILFGDRVTSAPPGSVQDLLLVVSDIVQARTELMARGADVSDVFHNEGGGFYREGTSGRIAGPDPAHGSYQSYATFPDPDGNRWVLQEVTERLPGR